MGEGGREALEGGDLCILIIDPHCCTTETDTTLKAIILQLKSLKNRAQTNQKMYCLLKLGNLPNKELPLVSLSNPAPTKQKKSLKGR